ncbi:ABC transporter ATP-binding protein [Streptomyces armeniacus]|uniref:ABC transporter ATP-binding protein n=1 Tax=Streptomyces armeniacus TaxID=83291 RepID=A0A345XQ33_9ACTN|nr:ABC transporter ATP-binding protein [Streptomyces armeniacus]AXK33749.1 ABC transporter ATP-binding protein [Streptomyces armeniacus]
MSPSTATPTEDPPAARPEPAAALRASGVGVSYPGGRRRPPVRVLADVALDLRPGTVTGLVGESGCGKTTLARVLAGLQRPTEGTVTLDGEDLWSLPPGRRTAALAESVAMVYQDPGSSLNPRLPVRTIVRDPLDIRRTGTPAARDRRVTELMDLVGLPPSAAGRRPGELSGGQRQRVAIARALALEPRYLVADEPTSALDVSVRAQVLNLLVRLRAELGLAMVYISHDIQTVRHLSDDVAVMYLGHVVEHGAAPLVTEAPAHPYTAALFSATPSLTRAAGDRIVLDGNPPSVRARPPGCPFAPRCWRVTEECRRELPGLEAPGTGRAPVRCIHPLPAPAPAT